MKNLTAFLLSLLLVLTLSACGANLSAPVSEPDEDAQTEAQTEPEAEPIATDHNPTPQTMQLTRFASGVGEYDGISIIGNGEQGHLMYGPYTPLAQGSYRIHITGALLDGELDAASYFDVANDIGKERLIVVSNLGQFVGENGTFDLTVDFEANHDLSKAEFRIFVNAGAVLSIDSVTLTDTTKYASGELEWPDGETSEEETSFEAAEEEAVDDAD